MPHSTRMIGSERSRDLRYRTTGKALLAFLSVALVVTLYLERTLAPVQAFASDDATAVAEAIDRLSVVGSVLFTAAHPDDENSILLP